MAAPALANECKIAIFSSNATRSLQRVMLFEESRFMTSASFCNKRSLVWKVLAIQRLNSKCLLTQVKTLMNTCITPGYLFSSRRSLNISMDPYHPVNGAAGNCKPPISANRQDTPGNGNHSKPREAISGILKIVVV